MIANPSISLQGGNSTMKVKIKKYFWELFLNVIILYVSSTCFKKTTYIVVYLHVFYDELK